jgi:hypothetical protein
MFNVKNVLLASGYTASLLPTFHLSVTNFEKSITVKQLLLTAQFFDRYVDQTLLLCYTVSCFLLRKLCRSLFDEVF